MRMEDYAIIGVVVNSSDELTPLIGKQRIDGGWDCFYNNEPYNVVYWDGFGDIAIKTVERNEIDATTGKQRLSQPLLHAIYCILKGTRGEAQGIIFLEDGFLVVKDTDFFKAVKQPQRLGDGTDVIYTTYVDVAEMDEYTEDAEEIMEILEDVGSFTLDELKQ